MSAPSVEPTGPRITQHHPREVLLPLPIHHPQSRLQAFAQEAPSPPLAQPLKLSSSPHTPGSSPGGRSWLRAVRTPVLGAGRLQQVRAVVRVFKTGVGSGRGTAGATSLVRIKPWYDRRARPLEEDTEARGRGRPVPHAHLGALVPRCVPDWSTGAQPPPQSPQESAPIKKYTLLWTSGSAGAVQQVRGERSMQSANQVHGIWRSGPSAGHPAPGLLRLPLGAPGPSGRCWVPLNPRKLWLSRGSRRAACWTSRRPGLWPLSEPPGGAQHRELRGGVGRSRWRGAAGSGSTRKKGVGAHTCQSSPERLSSSFSRH